MYISSSEMLLLQTFQTCCQQYLDLKERSDRKRMSVERDRLSSLPDDLIHKILSFVSIKHVVQTSVFSTRWRFIWTSMPYLNFLAEDFPSLLQFSQVVAHVLSRRNDQIKLTSLNLSFHGEINPVFARRILNYAFSHNVQDMTITCLTGKKINFPLFHVRSHSLKHLTFVGSTVNHYITHTPTSMWELPALTTLHLAHVTMYGIDNNVGIISKCANLKSLALHGCKITGSGHFSICHTKLSNLLLENGEWGWNSLNVVAPQLKNLTIVNCDWVHLSASDLVYLKYRTDFYLKFSTDCLPCLEEVDLCISNAHMINVRVILDLLQQLHNIRVLSLNLETIEVLSLPLSVELFSNQPPPFANLKSLKIYPVKIYPVYRQLEGQSRMSNEVKRYLLDKSPGASFTIVPREAQNFG